MAATVVEVKNVGLAEFAQVAVLQDETIGELRWDSGLAVNVAECQRRAVADIVGAVVGDVEVERAVAIDIGESDGHASEH
jgi:hypothetical protein